MADNKEKRMFYGRELGSPSEERSRSEERRAERQEALLNRRIERELKTGRGLSARTKADIIDAETNRWAASIVDRKAAQVHAGNVSLQDNKPVEVEISDSGPSQTSFLMTSPRTSAFAGADGGGGSAGLLGSLP